MRIATGTVRERGTPFQIGGQLLVSGVLGRRGVPAFVLVLSLVPVFLFGPDRGYFYVPEYVPEGFLGGYHDDITRHHMQVAVNLDAEHNFLGFYRQMLTPEGERTYVVYNRFPVGGHLLIKLVTLPFSDDLSARLRAARLLMLAFFVGAALLAYLSLSRLTSSRLVAFLATLLSFASWQTLFYNDMVASEGMMDLFGMMLVLHGMAVFCTPRLRTGGGGAPVGGSSGFGQLLGKTCAALLLGWHVYGLVLSFVGLGLADAAAGRGRINWRRLYYHLTLGVVALVFGVAVLGCNFAREYFALGGETPLVELPSVKSTLVRTGIEHFTKSDNRYWGWTDGHLLEMFSLVGRVSAPHALTMFLPPMVLAALGMAVSLSTFGLICLRSTPHRLPLAALALAGFCWMLPMFRSFLGHPHETMFFIGIPLVFFSLVLLRLPAFVPRPDKGRQAGYVVMVLASVAVSSWVVGEIKREHQDVKVQETRMADMHTIRRWVKNKVVYVSRSASQISHELNSYLTDSVFISYYLLFADFVIAPELDGVDSLTPENRQIFLYRPAAYNAVRDVALRPTRARYEHAAQTGTPVIESDYDVYHIGGELLYVGEEGACTSTASPIFLLHVWPAHEEDLVFYRRRYGFDNKDFRRNNCWQRGEAGYVVARLPTYEIAKISTGQYVINSDGSFHVLWKAHYAPSGEAKAALRATRTRYEQAAQTGTPVIESDYDIYHIGRELLYVGEEGTCTSSAPRELFLRIWPAYEKDLVSHRRGYGFDYLHFKKVNYWQRGETCYTVAKLPKYEIAEISTGQYVKNPDGSFHTLWKARYTPPERSKAPRAIQ